MRECFGYAVVLIILIASFFIILRIAVMQINFAKVFPDVDCDKIDTTYGATLPEYAYYDYLFVEQTTNMASSGCL